VAFEDSMTGVASARAAGLYTVAYPCQLTLGHDLSAAHLVIDSLSDITLADLGRAVRG
jgi:beta-phosphoglucomutase-like phosphatase (HAD superfamily)